MLLCTFAFLALTTLACYIASETGQHDPIDWYATQRALTAVEPTIVEPEPIVDLATIIKATSNAATRYLNAATRLERANIIKAMIHLAAMQRRHLHTFQVPKAVAA